MDHHRAPTFPEGHPSSPGAFLRPLTSLLGWRGRDPASRYSQTGDQFEGNRTLEGRSETNIYLRLLVYTLILSLLLVIGGRELASLRLALVVCSIHSCEEVTPQPLVALSERI